MKKRLITIIFLAGTLILTGCNKSSELQNNALNKVNSDKFASEVSFSELSVYNEYALIDIPSGYTINGEALVVNDTIHATVVNHENSVYQDMSFDKDGNCINTACIETSSDYYYDILTDDEGNLYYISIIGSEDMEEAELFFEKVSSSGEKIFSVDLEQYVSVEDMYLKEIRYMPDGNIYINNEINVIVFNNEGDHLFDIDENIENVLDIISSKDGKIFMCYYNEEYEIKLREVNSDKKTLGEEYPIDEDIMFLADGTGEFDIYIADTNEVYGINLETGEKFCILNWLESNINGTSVNNFRVLSDGKIVISYFDSEYNTKISIFDKVDADTVANQKVITLAGNYIDEGITSAVVDFNKKHNEYKINVVDYAKYATNDNWNAGKDKFNADMISGNIPDIFFLLDDTQIASFSSKNLLVDMNELINYDSSLKRSDYFENVLKAFETDGKLYYISPCYSILTIVGNPKYISNIPENWNMSDFIDVAENLDDGVQIFEDQYMTADYMMQNIMAYSINDFVDFENKTCNFDNENFIRLLEFSKRLSANDEEIYNEIHKSYDEYYQNVYSKYRNGDILLMFTTICDVHSLYQLEAIEFGDDVEFIGLPSKEGNKSYINSYVKLGISAKSDNQDVAWEFIKYLLSDEYQKKQCEFPLKKSVLEEKMDNAMQPYTYEDENGKTVVDTENIVNYNGVDFKMGYMTEQHKKRYMDFISSVDCDISYNNDVINIVLEETESYFKGDKPVSEVAKIIQNRVNTYINETL